MPSVAGIKAVPTGPFSLKTAAYLFQRFGLPLDVVQLIFAHLHTFTDYATQVIQRFQWIPRIPSMFYEPFRTGILWKPTYVKDSMYTGTISFVLQDYHRIPYMRLFENHRPFMYNKISGTFLECDAFDDAERATITLALQTSTWTSHNPFRQFYSGMDPSDFSTKELKALAAFVGAHSEHMINVFHAFAADIAHISNLEETQDLPYLALIIVGVLKSARWEALQFRALQNPTTVAQVWTTLKKLGSPHTLLRFFEVLKRGHHLGVVERSPVLDRILGLGDEALFKPKIKTKTADDLGAGESIADRILKRRLVPKLSGPL
jgi:hypothetical protein